MFLRRPNFVKLRSGRKSVLLRAVGTKSSATTTVKQFYDAINRRSFEEAEVLIGDDCRYEDMVYPEPFLGRANVTAFFRKICSDMPDELVFVIDEITEGTGDTVGLTWHVELKGTPESPEPVPFPFGRGCSFYRVGEDGRIVYGRDVVEPSIKPAQSAIKLLKLIAPLVRKLGPAASDPRASAPLVWWAGYAAYWWIVMLNPDAPGNPIYSTTPETLEQVTAMSLNFFYVNPFLHSAGIDMVPDIAVQPQAEAVFNWANAYSLMMLPLMLNDKVAPKNANRVAWWTGVMFLTNIFMMPWMAIRVGPRDEAPTSDAQSDKGPSVSPLLAQAFGATALAVTAASVAWLFAARPELAPLDPAARIAGLVDLLKGDRVAYAFGADMTLYYLYQTVLMGEQGAPAALRFTPFFGQALWLLQGMKAEGEKSA